MQSSLSGCTLVYIVLLCYVSRVVLCKCIEAAQGIGIERGIEGNRKGNREVYRVVSSTAGQHLLNRDNLNASAVLITSTYACNSKRRAEIFRL